MIATPWGDFTRGEKAFHMLKVSFSQLLKNMESLSLANTLSSCRLTQHAHAVVQSDDDDVPIAGQHASIHDVSGPFHVGPSMHKHHHRLWVVPCFSESCEHNVVVINKSVCVFPVLCSSEWRLLAAAQKCFHGDFLTLRSWLQRRYWCLICVPTCLLSCLWGEHDARGGKARYVWIFMTAEKKCG